MTRLERKRRAPDLKSLGIGVLAGAVVTYSISGGKVLGAATMAAAGAACYYWGMVWE
ncbi:hypothetical protein [Alcanivorax sp.]|uniref:hypothetical protein n=1 Tax=Alcanivorax sp. TaxID=1872427 RepID=UPI0025C2D8B9|nr:hypothetical protein [Alcanivorax sp.]